MPNLVIIFTDDQGYADVGVFGAKDSRLRTSIASLRKVASSRTSTSAQPVCSASRAALLTGCYSNRIGIHGALGPAATHGIADGEMTLAELVKQKGYATGMVGKWHLGRPAQFSADAPRLRRIFRPAVLERHVAAASRGSPAHYPPLPLIEGDRVLKEQLTHEDQAQLTTQYTERAVRFIEKNKDRPFFLYVAPQHAARAVARERQVHRASRRAGLYGDVIEEIDWSVGEILAALKRSGVEEKHVG